MPSMATLVRKISQKIIPQAKGKDVSEPAVGAHSRGPSSQDSEQSSSKREMAPDVQVLKQLSSVSSHSSSFKSGQSCSSPPAIAPASPEVGPETQTNGDFEGLSMQDLCAAMKLDAKSQNDLVDVCAEIIASTVKRNDARENLAVELNAFEGPAVKISPGYYVRRVFKYGGCSPCCLAIGCLYLQRLKARYHSVRLSSTSFIRLFAVAVMEASKFFDDHFLSNRQWADIAGVTVEEMNQLELEFLFRIQFDLNVDRTAYNSYVAEMLGLESVGPEVDQTKEDEHFEKVSSYCDVTQASQSF